jgi:hypothetical protein
MNGEECTYRSLGWATHTTHGIHDLIERLHVVKREMVSVSAEKICAVSKRDTYRRKRDYL